MKDSLVIVAICVVAAVIAVFIAFSHGSGEIHIGVLKEQKDFFTQTDKISASTGKTIVFHYYDHYKDLRAAASAGELDIYFSPLFEHIAHPGESLAITAVQADYILGGRQRKEPATIGINETYISKLLMEHAQGLRGVKYTTLFIEQEDVVPFLQEEIIDYAIFRDHIPQKLRQQGVEPLIALSELGFRHDVLCVKKELLLRYDTLVESLFLSSSSDSHLLPPEDEVKNAVRILFQSGNLTERKRYTDYVHIK